MTYRLLCVDIDGTLLNGKREISAYTKEKIKEAMKFGVVVAITTGRFYENAVYYSGLIGEKVAVIASNGAIIKARSGMPAICRGVLGKQNVERILRICHVHGATVNFHTKDGMICSSLLVYLFMRKFFLRSMGKMNFGKIDLKYIPGKTKMMRLLEQRENEIVKAEVIARKLETISRLRRELLKLGTVEIVSSDRHNIEITAGDVSKGRGAEFLARHLRITREEVIAVGDSENDLSMIEFAGLGVAMGNSPELIKSKADYITDTNDRDGVAKVIDKFILGGQV